VTAIELEATQSETAESAAIIDDTKIPIGSTKQIQYRHGDDVNTIPSDSREQRVYMHNETDSEFESTQSLQLNPEVSSTS
jgi:hypothetical protein